MSPEIQVAALCGIALLLIAAAIFIAMRFQRSPEKREKLRRLAVNRQGRLGDAMITEANDHTLYYSYTIRGVHYTASQDVTPLRDRLPENPERLIGIASIKYATNNPANSILLCEEWSGLRINAREPVPEVPQAEPVQPDSIHTNSLP
jgi:hypothetical protein